MLMNVCACERLCWQMCKQSGVWALADHECDCVCMYTCSGSRWEKKTHQAGRTILTEVSFIITEPA